MTLPSLEVCVDSAASAVAAEQGGGQRVELCAGLIEGGTTPSAGMIAATLGAVTIPVHVMIRPRGGDFLYTTDEVRIMLADIDAARREGAHGVVFGALTADGEIDRVITGELAEAARPMAVTFHRAFDMARDPSVALQGLIDLGIERVLTSGQHATAVEGLAVLRDLVSQAGRRIVVMPGGGIRPHNVREIVAGCRPRELHVSGRETVPSGMRHRNEAVRFGVADEYEHRITTAANIAAFFAAPGSL